MNRNLIERFARCAEDIPEGSAVGQYLKWLDDTVEKKDPIYVNNYEPIVRQEDRYRKENRVFLSVVMRTQGKRPEMLREALLCLMGQGNQDFEVVLIGHKLDEAHLEAVKDIIDEQPDMLKDRIRFFELNYGNRTAPLNFGFAHARGEYIAVLDDDDIVTDNWVDEFFKTAGKNPGALLHARAFLQEWETIGTDAGVEALRAVAAPIDIYCRDFDIFSQLRGNKCPVSVIGFPSYIFRKLGIIFDESLTTTEDWDYLMRCAFIAGVAETPAETFFYRRWHNSESSETVHKHEEWDKNFAVIQEKFRSMPLIITDGAQRSLTRETMEAMEQGWNSRFPKINTATLYIDRGSGLSQDDIVTEDFVSNGRVFDSMFVMPRVAKKPPVAIRFDPGEEGLLIVKNVTAVLIYTDGSREVRTLKGTQTNGYEGKNSVFFLKRDPWILWKNIVKPLKTVRIMGEISGSITDKMLEEYLVSSVHKNSRIRSMINKLRGR